MSLPEGAHVVQSSAERLMANLQLLGLEQDRIAKVHFVVTRGHECFPIATPIPTLIPTPIPTTIATPIATPTTTPITTPEVLGNLPLYSPRPYAMGLSRRPYGEWSWHTP